MSCDNAGGVRAVARVLFQELLVIGMHLDIAIGTGTRPIQRAISGYPVEVDVSTTTKLPARNKAMLKDPGHVPPACGMP